MNQSSAYRIGSRQNSAYQSGFTSLGVWFDESEPHVDHASVTGVICFDEKRVIKGMKRETLLYNIDSSIAPKREDEINQEVLDLKQSRLEAGKIQAQNDLSTACEDYLLDIEFSESITNLDYGSSKGLLDPILESQIPLSCSNGIDTCGMSYTSGLAVQEAQSQNAMFGLTNSELHDLSPNKCERQMLIDYNAVKFPITFTPGDISNVDDVAGFFAEDVSSEKMNSRFVDQSALTSKGISSINATKSERQDVDCESSDVHKSLASMSPPSTPQAVDIDIPVTQKRLRKPTKRYIDESSDLNATRPRKKGEVSSSSKKGEACTSASKDKILRIRYQKKPRTESLGMDMFPEESTCKAIQVPFASLGNEECDKRQASNAIQVLKPQKEAAVVKSHKDAIQKSHKEATVLKSHEEARVLKSHKEATVLKSHKEATVLKSHKEARVQKSNKEDTLLKSHKEATVIKYNKEATVDDPRDYAVAPKKSDQDGARRKHHRLWTVSEVRKLIDGVAQYGVGRWSHIKKLYFSSSVHRTPVDLKDKWRNLLKACYLQKQSKTTGKGKHNLSWRPLPKSILHRVGELANMHPYPRNQRCNIRSGSPCPSSPMHTNSNNIQ